MLAIPLGPLALPVAPVVLAAAVLVAIVVARALARRRGGDATAAVAATESAAWQALGAGLLAARLAHVAANASAYAAQPLAAIDVRDGGWNAAAGFAAGAAVAAVHAWRRPALRGAIAAGALALAATWGGGQAIVRDDATAAGAPLPALVLLPLPLPLPPAVATPAAAADRAAHAAAVASTPSAPALPQLLAQVTAGRMAVVNVWASWCGPCRAEMPALAAARARHPDVAFVFVNQREPAADVARYLRAERLDAIADAVWLDPVGALAPALGSPGLPATVFVDAAGRRVDAHFGALNAAAIDARVAALRRASPRTQVGVDARASNGMRTQSTAR